MTENQRKEQGERLRKIRKDLGMTQGDFADLISTEQTQLSRTENGSYAVQISYLSKLAQLGYNLNWLMTGMGDMKVQGNTQESMTLEPTTPYNQSLEEIKEFLKSKFPDFNM